MNRYKAKEVIKMLEADTSCRCPFFCVFFGPPRAGYFCLHKLNALWRHTTLHLLRSPGAEAEGRRPHRPAASTSTRGRTRTTAATSTPSTGVGDVRDFVEAGWRNSCQFPGKTVGAGLVPALHEGDRKGRPYRIRKSV